MALSGQTNCSLSSGITSPSSYINRCDKAHIKPHTLAAFKREGWNPLKSSFLHTCLSIVQESCWLSLRTHRPNTRSQYQEEEQLTTFALPDRKKHNCMHPNSLFRWLKRGNQKETPPALLVLFGGGLKSIHLVSRDKRKAHPKEAPVQPFEMPRS